MKICFYGVGGVGGYFGSLAAQRFNAEHDIYFIARGKHKEAICTNGLTLKKSGGAEIINVRPEKCTDNIDEIPVCNIIVLSVKGYDLNSAVKDIEKISQKDSVILPLLNGVDIYERIRKQLKKSKILPSCVYIGTHIESPGIINQNGGNAKIIMGCDPEFPDYYPESLLTILKESKIRFSWETNVQTAIWVKFMFIAAYGLVTATFNKTMGEVFENPELSKTTKLIMSEIREIAGKLKIPLESDIVENSYLKGKLFPYDAKTSLQRDVESKGEINEGEIFGGTIIRLGDEFKTDVSITRDIYHKLTTKFK